MAADENTFPGQLFRRGRSEDRDALQQGLTAPASGRGELLRDATRFFSDAQPYEELAHEALAPRVSRADPAGPIRVWVPACATGEGAYSLAIALAEQQARAGCTRDLQIFATDADQDAVAIARAGSYPESIALDLAPQRLQRYFTLNDHRYIVSRSIRDSITFAVHNLMTDPPFSRLDLVSCGNVFHHLELEAQQRLLRSLHFALRPEGVLFVPEAQAIGAQQAQLFAPISGRGNIFRRLGSAGTDPQPELIGRIESALRATRIAHQDMLARLESGNEELRAANEEVRSMNAELKSTNEDLSSSQGKLQRMNAELSQLNQRLQEKMREVTAVNDDLSNLLGSADIATVFLDKEMRLKRFTAAAARVLNLLPVDHGKPLHELTLPLVGVDLSCEARAILDSLFPIEKEVMAGDERHYLLRGRPYRTEDSLVKGVVLTLVDVSTLKQAERQLRSAREQLAEDLRRMTRLHALGERLAAPGEAHALLEEILRAAIEITSATMGNIQQHDSTGALWMVAQVGFEPAFRERFARVDAHSGTACSQCMASRQRVLVEDVENSPLFGAGQSREVLRGAGVRAVQCTPLLDRMGRFLGIFSTHYDSPHRFAEEELRWLDLLARHAADALDRQAGEQALMRAHADLECRVAQRTQWLSLLHELSQSISEAPTWDTALQRVLELLCNREEWQIGYVYLPDPQTPNMILATISYMVNERFRAFHEFSEQQRYRVGDALPGRVFAAGNPLYARDVAELLHLTPVRAAVAERVGLRAGIAFPIRINREVIGVIELFSDRPHPRNDWFESLLPAVADQLGRVLERERTTARMADLVWREQQDLLHTLHDALGQTLTGLGMLSSGLRQQLAVSDERAAGVAGEIARQAQQALEQVRQLSRSLFPVEVEASGLTAALRGLASATESLHKVRVRVDGETPRRLVDGAAATQLYRIAQEAVTNAIKHAQAHTICVRIEGRRAALKLRIVDDGVGIGRAATRSGIGLQIMRYRAQSIGGTLTVEPGPERGTVVTCTVRAAPHRRRAELARSPSPNNMECADVEGR